MKKLAGFVFFFVAFVLGAYYVMGFMVHKTLIKHVQAFNDSPYYKLNLDQYQQGWFCSSAVLGISMQLPAQTSQVNGQIKTTPETAIQFNLPLQIKHGPFIHTKSGLRFGLGQVATRPESNYGFLIDYRNRSVFDYALPSFSMDVGREQQDGPFMTNWAGLSTRLKASPGFDHLKGYIHLLGLQVIANHVDFNLGSVRYGFELDRMLDGLYLGHGQFLLAALRIKSADGDVFDMHNLAFHISSTLVEDSLHFNVDASLDKLSLDNKDFGPGEFKLRLSGLDPKAMAKIYQQLGLISNPNQSSLAMLAIMAELPKLVDKGTKLEFSESLIVPEGKVTGHLNLSLPKAVAQDPQQWAKVVGSGQFRAPQAVVKTAMLASLAKQAPKPTPTAQTDPNTPATPPVTEVAAQVPANPEAQAEQALQSLVNQGVLKIDGQDYVIDFKVENRQLLVNGKPFDPAKLGQ